MQLYDCTVRLSGSMYNEVPKVGVTAAEIAVLKAIHQAPDAGVEAVINIKAGENVRRDDHEERQRLEETYGPALARIEHIRNLSAILGHATVPLPKTIPGVDALPPPKSGKRARVEPVQPDVTVSAGADTADEQIGEREFA